MLLSFRFANHRSFRDEQQLNLTPVYGDGADPDVPAPPAVQVIGVFGANASGKSNCLGALAFMRQLAVQSDRAGITAPTALFLSTVARFGQSRPDPDSKNPQPLHDTYRWFYLTGQRIDTAAGKAALLTPGVGEPDDARRLVVDLLQAADMGIADVLVTPELGGTESLRASPPARQLLHWLSGPGAGLRTPRIQFAHQGPHGTTLLDLDEESAGTRQLLALGLRAAAMLRTGATMLVDEIDASMHPNLTAKLISLFRSPNANPFGSQLIFTSHDTALLGTLDAEEILRRDEIWFVEKDDAGVSSLYPLTDFKPRKEGENRQRRYLNGSYGAVPDLSTHPFEQALTERGGADDATAG